MFSKEVWTGQLRAVDRDEGMNSTSHRPYYLWASALNSEQEVKNLWSSQSSLWIPSREVSMKQSYLITLHKWDLLYNFITPSLHPYSVSFVAVDLMVDMLLKEAQTSSFIFPWIWVDLHVFVYMGIWGYRFVAYLPYADSLEDYLPYANNILDWWLHSLREVLRELLSSILSYTVSKSLCLSLSLSFFLFPLLSPSDLKSKTKPNQIEIEILAPKHMSVGTAELSFTPSINKDIDKCK